MFLQGLTYNIFLFLVLFNMSHCKSLVIALHLGKDPSNHLFRMAIPGTPKDADTVSLEKHIADMVFAAIKAKLAA